MISSIDTNILLDIFLPDPIHGEPSLQLLERASQRGALIICDIVYCELSPQFNDKNLLDESLDKIGVKVISADTDILYQAGQLWRRYRKQQNSRERIIPDFIIGAFALNQGNHLLTRDRGFYRAYFQDLKIN